MIWLNATLYRAEEVGRDKLGNPVTEPYEMEAVLVRPTPYAGAKAGPSENAFTEAHRMFQTISATETLEAASEMAVDGRTYSIESVRDMGRWRLVRAKAVKQP